MREPPQALRMFCHHLCDAIIGEFCRLQPDFGRQVIKINRRADGNARDVHANAIHPRHFGIGVDELRFQLGRVAVYVEIRFAVFIVDAGVIALRVLADGIENGGWDNVVVQIDGSHKLIYRRLLFLNYFSPSNVSAVLLLIHSRSSAVRPGIVSRSPTTSAGHISNG